VSVALDQETYCAASEYCLTDLFAIPVLPYDSQHSLYGCRDGVASPEVVVFSRSTVQVVGTGEVGRHSCEQGPSRISADFHLQTGNKTY
jgi:hypothetical protein